VPEGDPHSVESRERVPRIEGRKAAALTSARVVFGAVLLFPLESFVVSAYLPLALRLTVVALWLTAIALPHVALVVLALVVPFGSALISALELVPAPFTEALVLATLSGIALSIVPQRVDLSSLGPPWRRSASSVHHAVVSEAAPRRFRFAPALSLELAALLFGGIVLCSLAVVLVVSQAGLALHWSFVRELVVSLDRDYLRAPAEQWTSIGAAAHLLEGVLLLIVTMHDARTRADRSVPLMQALVLSGVVAAIVAFQRLTALVPDPESLRDLAAKLFTARTAGHLADANAAGSFFAMIACIALALYRFEARQRLQQFWGLVAVVLVAALWFTGSRAAIVSIALVLVCAAILQRRTRASRVPLSWMLGIALAVAVVLAAIAFDPRGVARRTLTVALNERFAFVVTGLRVMASAPLFGVGIGRYFDISGAFMPTSIYWFHFRENAHNNFVQIGGELGLVGLLAFLWLLGAAAARAVRGLQGRNDPLLAGALAAVAAFMVTWAAGHPLLVSEVAFPFWMLLGALVGHADAAVPAIAEPAETAEPQSLIGRRSRSLVGVALLLLLATIPLRARHETAALNFEKQSFGFFDWEETEASGRFRWTMPKATFFVSGAASELDVSICSAWAGRRADPTMITIAIDGQVMNKMQVVDGNWRIVHLGIPPTATRPPFHRVDITTRPPWSPAALGSRDSRVLGVQVGAIAAR
jgi:hypothetical protein